MYAAHAAVPEFAAVQDLGRCQRDDEGFIDFRQRAIEIACPVCQAEGARRPQLIVSLSTIPPRFGKLGPTLNSLLRQKLRPERLILYIPERYRRFPEWDGALPQVPAGVSIHRVDVDYGPATKVLPALREFTGQNVDILFCDDDVVYDSRWTQRFALLRDKMPFVCLAEAGKDILDIEAGSRPADRLPRAARSRRDMRFRLRSMVRHRQLRASEYVKSGFCDVFLGVGGVMLRPEFLTEAAFAPPDVLWTVDDYWLSGNLAVNGIPIWLNADAPRRRERGSRRIAALKAMVHDEHDRTAANAACVDYYRRNYGIWLPTE